MLLQMASNMITMLYEQFPQNSEKTLVPRLPKRTFSTRHSKKVRMTPSQPSIFHETSQKLENFTRILRHNNYEYRPLARVTFQAYKKRNRTISAEG